MSRADLTRCSLSKADLEGSKLIPHGFQPTVKVGVGYALKEVALGNELQIDQTQEEPEVNFVDGVRPNASQCPRQRQTDHLDHHRLLHRTSDSSLLSWTLVSGPRRTPSHRPRSWPS